MNFLTASRAKRNNAVVITPSANLLSELPAVPRVPATVGGVHLHRRYHVGAGIADLLALLAGLGSQEVGR